MTVVIGTAGHIDHGKTSLLRALTGIDADRLPEERARGMTIDVGYAHLALGDGTELDFVDVPGHDRLVGNMLVGAGEIDAALLVVAADDGPRPQTHEHLELLDALGLSVGLAVVTKIDAVPAERAAEVRAEVERLLAATSLRGAPVLAASATTGVGLDDVRRELVAVRDRVMVARPSALGVSRLAVDRVFLVRGRGTVVTGTLRGAALANGALLRVVPGGAADRPIRVREVQVHGRAVERAEAGRVALNLAAGEATRVLGRGVVLTTDPAIVATDRLLVALGPVAPLPAGDDASSRPRRGVVPDGLPADRTRVAVHLGTARVAAAVGRAGRDGIALGGGRATAILRLDRPIAAAPGDRLVLRRESPPGTLASGRILDPNPVRGMARRRATPERLRALAGAEAGSDAWAAACLDLHGVLVGPSGRIAPDLAAAVEERLVAEVGWRPGLGSAELVRAGAAELRRRIGPIAAPGGGGGGATSPAADPASRIVAARLDALVAAGQLVRHGDRVSPPGAGTGPSPELSAAMDRLEGVLAVVSPPSLAAAARDAGCPAEGIRLLDQAERIVRLSPDLAWARSTWDELAGRALAMAAAAPLSPAAYRDAIGTSRKYVMAILEELDRRAVLRRTPAGHVPGPRAATLGTWTPGTATARRATASEIGR